MEFLSIYAFYIKIFLKAKVEYRISFFTGIIGNFYCYFITYSTLWVLTKQFTSIGGWSFDEVSILYGLNIFTYSIAGMLFWYTVYQLDQEITSGNLDSYLIRPMGVIKQMVCRRFGDTYIGMFAVTLFFMVLALTKIGYSMTVFSYIYLFIAIISGILLHSGAMILLGSLSFWMLRSRELAWLLYFDVRSLVNYPISIYPKLIQVVLTYIIPWAMVNYYPSLIILKKVQTFYDFSIGLVMPLISISIFILSIYVFNRGLSKYSGSGS